MVLLIDRLGYAWSFLASSLWRVRHGLATLTDSLRESIHHTPFVVTYCGSKLVEQVDHVEISMCTFKPLVLFLGRLGVN